MGQPTPSDVHVDTALTDFSIAYIQDQDNFIAGKAVPSKPVKHKTDKYFIFNKNDWLRDDAVKQRAMGTAAPRSGMSLSQGSYDAQPWWTAVPLDEQVLANADPSLPLDQAATELVTQRMLIRRERLFAAAFMTTGVWSVDTTPAILWDDYASDPQHDIDIGKKSVLSTTGFEPNTLTVGYAVHQALKRHPLIKDMIKYTSSESVTATIIAKFLEIDNYFVTKAIYSTTNEGSANPAYAFAVGPSALLTYNDGSPSIMKPTAYAVFAWTGLTGVNDSGVRIDQFYDRDTKEDVIRGEFAFAMEVTGKDLGYFFNNVTAA